VTLSLLNSATNLCSSPWLLLSSQRAPRPSETQHTKPRAGGVEIEGVRRPVLVAIGGDEEAPIIGYTTLENLGFKVNPITGRLEGASNRAVM